MFELATITAEQKRDVRKEYDGNFPVPPVIAVKTPQGAVARFNLEDTAYQAQLSEWHDSLSYAVLAATMGMIVSEVKALELLLPNDFMSELFSTAELINGIQSEPLADLIKDSIWSPEVLTWVETYRSKGDDISITDKPLYRQMEAMVAAGWKFLDWESATPRERLLLLNWYDYKQLREAYISWWSTEKNKTAESKNPMRATLPQ
jgi:hypothetical protein